MGLVLKYNAIEGTLDLHGALPSLAKRKARNLLTYNPVDGCYQGGPSEEVLSFAVEFRAKIDLAALRAVKGQRQSDDDDGDGELPEAPRIVPGPAYAADAHEDECQTPSRTADGEMNGRFVISSENSLGIGKLEEIEGNSALIAYFDSPGREHYRVASVPKHSLSPVDLPWQTRVYHYDEERDSWITGRIVGPKNDIGYLVQFPNRDHREVPEAELFTRYARPIEDPTHNLAARLTESFYQSKRQPFLRAYVEQRSVCGGLSGLAASAVDLEEHQIQTVNSILQDPVQRYLLADEVGLGKTIEAAAIVKQHVLEAPSEHDIAILVPNVIVEQWVNELESKFFLGRQLSTGSIRVLGYDDGAVIVPNSATMVVIDEAHTFGTMAFSDEFASFYEHVCESTRSLRRLLLLSATPVLHNEEAYLAMLHLLDPETFGPPAESLGAFRLLIENRQVIANAYDVIQPEMPGSFMLSALESVLTAYPHDTRLSEFHHRLLPLCDWDEDLENLERTALVRQLRTHIGECYKLHRRMIRTRRTEETEALLPGRNGHEVVTYESYAEQECYRLTDEWRLESMLEMNSSTFRDQVRSIYEALASCPDVFGRTVEGLVGHLPSKLPEAIAKWKECPRKLEAIGGLLIDLFECDSDLKAIVFTGSECQSIEVSDFLGGHLDWGVTTNPNAFGDGAGERVLVCSPQAEQGLNLRVLKGAMIHYCLPLNASRVEQRLGRMDRYGRGRSVKSYVLLEENTDFARGWLAVLSQCLKVFDRSIASLQYSIANEMKLLWRSVAEEGGGCWQRIINRLGGADGIIENELMAVTQQDALDAISQDDALSSGLITNLVERDADCGTMLGETSAEWLDALGFRRWNDHDVSRNRVLRWGYRSSGSSQTLVALPDVQHLADLFDPSAPQPFFDGRNPGTHPLTFDRLISQRHGCRLVRVGDLFLDWLRHFTVCDERGTAAIFWRYANGIGVEGDYRLRFVFHVLVEAAIGLGDPERCSSRELALKKRADMWFPPELHSAIVDANGTVVDNERETKLLSIPFRSEELLSDYNLNARRWGRTPLGFDATEWPKMCNSAREGALGTLTSSQEQHDRIQSALEAASNRMLIDIALLRSRQARNETLGCSHSECGIEESERDWKSILAAIETPARTVVAVTAIFLSDNNPFGAE